MSKTRLNTLRWILIVIVALVFLGAAGMKLVNYQDSSAAEFAHWGFPPWMRYAVAVVEIAGAITLFFPATLIYSATILVLLMIGAMVTHALNDPFYYISLPLGLIATLLVIIYLHRKIYRN